MSSGVRRAQVGEVQTEQFDVCVVGSGPVGLSTAAALARRGLKVLVLEAGGERPHPDTRALVAARIADSRRHAPVEIAVARAFGGTGWLWGGRCVSLDAIDFERRGHIDAEGWPLALADVAPFHDEAAALLGCGGASFRCEPSEGLAAGDRDLDTQGAERWCDEPNIGSRLVKAGLLDGVTIALRATVVDLEIDDRAGAVKALIVRSGSETYRLGGARTIVVACGGLETVRLLLHAALHHACVLGGVDGPLGRFYMGHLSGKIAHIRFDAPGAAAAFNYVSGRGFALRRRLAFTRAALEAHELPNVIFYPDNPAMADPRHRSGLLSALWLILASPLGALLLPDAIRQSQIGTRRDWGAHARNLVLDLPRAIRDLVGVAAQRYILKRRNPHVFLTSGNNEYPLHFHGEHKPSRDSRVSLSAERDTNGMRRIAINLRFTREDAERIVKAHEVLDAALRRAGIGQLLYDAPADQRAASVLESARDGFHQIGLARMGREAATSVVDADCRVHGLANLYLAGSAVMRTGSQANPTFPAVALAVRLAQHLATQGRRRSAEPQRHDVAAVS